jgi:cytochrome c oxidase subunit 4
MSTIRRLGLTYLALMLLLALTVGSTFVPLGFGNTVINLAIAGAKTALVVVVFMEIGRSAALPRLVVGILGLWLLILFVISWITLRGV